MIHLQEQGISGGRGYARIADTENKELSISVVAKTETEAIDLASTIIKILKKKI